MRFQDLLVEGGLPFGEVPFSPGILIFLVLVPREQENEGKKNMSHYPAQ